MLEGSRNASSSAAGATRDRERGPELAQRRPSLERVGVLAGARPADGPSGCNPSAPSCRCSPCPSSSPCRRNRCCSHLSPTSRYHHAAHPQAALCAWQETIGRCAGSCSLWLPSGSVRQWRGGGQELAPSAVPMPRCAPRPRKARARGPDGDWSSSRLTSAAWPVRTDPLPSWGGFGAPG